MDFDGPTKRVDRYRQIEDLFFAVTMEAKELPKQEVLAASQNWLALLDAGDFVGCCNQAGRHFMIAPKQFEAVTLDVISGSALRVRLPHTSNEG